MGASSSKTILVHVCCAACFSYVQRILKNDNFEVSAYFYNPQVHGRAEYNSRLKEVKLFCEENDIKLIIPKYDVQEFLNPIMPYQDKNSIKYRWVNKRCTLCFSIILSHTVAEARNGKYDYFTTTMLTTPYKDHDEIWNIGLELETTNKVQFYYTDFRKGYWNGRNYARSHKMIIPTYCGCYYSAEEGRLE
jgi:hypothetical protein